MLTHRSNGGILTVKDVLVPSHDTPLRPLVGALVAVAAWGIVALWLLTTESPPTRVFVLYLPNEIVEFAGHVGAFAGFVACLSVVALALGHRGKELVRSSLAAFAIGIVCGIAVEAMQALGPTDRTAEWIDLVGNTIGAAMGAAAVVIAARRLGQPRRRRPNVVSPDSRSAPDRSTSGPGTQLGGPSDGYESPSAVHARRGADTSLLANARYPATATQTRPAN